MRKIIAQRMIESRRTSAHVHCMYEWTSAESSACATNKKPAFEQRHGVRLTFMPFFVRAASSHYSNGRSSMLRSKATNVHYHRNINVGIAVALDWGLIVPVLKNAGDLKLSRPAARNHRSR